jgi:hypothetical protein
MKVLALAKPFGGTFPEGNITEAAVVNPGSVGEEFQGAKLIGLADQRAEVGGDFYDFSDSYALALDQNGNVSNQLTWTTQEYLH